MNIKEKTVVCRKGISGKIKIIKGFEDFLVTGAVKDWLEKTKGELVLNNINIRKTTDKKITRKTVIYRYSILTKKIT